MRRKQYQLGSLKRRFINGRDVWLFQWREPGQKTRILGECSKMTRGEAEKEASIIRDRINANAGKVTGGPMSFERFVESVYIPLKLRKWKRGSTAIGSQADIRNHLIPTLGNRPMRSITRAELQDLLDSKAAAGLSSSVVKHCRFHLSGIFKVATGDGAVTRNPTTGLQNPVCMATVSKRTLTREEAIEIDRSLPPRERIPYRLAVVEGMRPGEILGLWYSDVNLASRQVVVNRRVYRYDVDTPKTTKSVRIVALSEVSASLLADWMASQRRQGPEDWVFQSENPESPLDRCNVLERWLKPKLAELGFGWVDFRVLRRTQSTLGDAIGLDRKVMADQRGHSGEVALDVYIQTPAPVMQVAVERLSKWLQ